jgi:hypothetical protein
MAYPACQYAERMQSLALNQMHHLNVFVATDDPFVISELRQCSIVARNAWEIHTMSGIAPSRSFKRENVFRIAKFNAWSTQSG